MSGWQHGYLAERGYAYNVIADQFPRRLATAALWQGHRPPDPSQAFRYVDLGCGQGVGLCVMAALHPQAHFIGVDFLPEHIAHGRSLAAAAQLANITFLEADFLELAAAPEAELQRLGLHQSDMAAAHGLLTWVAPPIRSALLRLAQRLLRPGGLFYVSYNTLPGRLDILPFQHLVQQLQQRGRSAPAALAGAQAHMQQLLAAGSNLNQAYPQLPGRLQALSAQNPAYLTQEYGNACWQPLFVDQAISLLEEEKFSYLGPLRLMEANHHWLPQPMQTLLAQQLDRALQELSKDLLLNQVFRRDLFCKGRDPLWPQHLQEQQHTLPLQALMPASRLSQADAFHFRTDMGELRGDPALFTPLLNPTEVTPLSTLLATQPSAQQGLQHLALLLDLQHLAVVDHPSPDPAPAQRLNQTIAAAAAAGAPYGVTALPGLGCHLPLTCFNPAEQPEHPYSPLLARCRAWS